MVVCVLLATSIKLQLAEYTLPRAVLSQGKPCLRTGEYAPGKAVGVARVRS